MIHGGDIYRNKVQMDFSVNLNPLGIPIAVQKALVDAIKECDRYPDIEYESLKRAIGRRKEIPPEHILCGNGASELFMAVVHGIRPKKISIPVPSFYGYEYAAKACKADVCYIPLKKEEEFSIEEGMMEEIEEGTDLLILANPNNPTGRLLPLEKMLQIVEECQRREIYLLVDECFIEFTGREEDSLLSYIHTYPNLIVVSAFTKTFAIPGVRLGYLMTGNDELRIQIKKQLPEWNLSIFAIRAGEACCLEKDYVHKAVKLIEEERVYLTGELIKCHVKVYPSQVNFLLLETNLPLYERMLEQGILIRDCSNFRGLGSGYYRIAVKSHEENRSFIHKCKQIAGLA